MQASIPGPPHTLVPGTWRRQRDSYVNAHHTQYMIEPGHRDEIPRSVVSSWGLLNVHSTWRTRGHDEIAFRRSCRTWERALLHKLSKFANHGFAASVSHTERNSRTAKSASLVQPTGVARG